MMMVKRVYSDDDGESLTSRMKSQNLFLEGRRRIRKSLRVVRCVVVKRNFIAKDDASRNGGINSELNADDDGSVG
jgi:hypothetical protein